MWGLEFTKNQKLTLLAIIGVAIIGLSAAHFRNSLNRSGDVLFTEPSQDGSAKVITTDSDFTYSGAANGGKVVFQVAGCVKTPGVYSLPTGSRIYEAIKSAGGAKPEADMQSINLAAKIDDASRIYIPAIGESSAGPTTAMPTIPVVKPSAQPHGASGSTTNSAKLSRPGEGLVHINSAGVDELQRLPGVGPSTAQKIMDFRTRTGGFKSPEQMMDVNGIGPKKWEKMRPFVAL
ncbi:MAG: helix-hairpin-helix domain-containing protein [Armatimonadota bacterium]